MRTKASYYLIIVFIVLFSINCKKHQKTYRVKSQDKRLKLKDYLISINAHKPKIKSLQRKLYVDSKNYSSPKFGEYSEIISKIDSIQFITYSYHDYIAPNAKPPYNSDASHNSINRDRVVIGKDTVILDYFFNKNRELSIDSYVLANIYSFYFYNNFFLLVDFNKYFGTGADNTLFSILIFQEQEKKHFIKIYNRLAGVYGIGDFDNNRILNICFKSYSEKFAEKDTIYCPNLNKIRSDSLNLVVNKKGYVIKRIR